MNFQGTIIAESLGDASILREVTIRTTKIEKVTQKHKTPWLTHWTLHTVEIPDEKPDTFAQKMSRSFDQNHLTSWFVDFTNDSFHFIIFPNRVFKVDINNPILYKEAKIYGITIGIPDYQLNFYH